MLVLTNNSIPSHTIYTLDYIRLDYIICKHTNILYVLSLDQQGVNQDSLRDVIIHCDGSHFTLLRPITPPSANTGCFKVPTLTYLLTYFHIHN